MPARKQFKIQNSKFSIPSKSGFTLIELMVAIAIIAVLAAVGLVVYSTAQKSGRVSKRLQDLGAMRTAIELFKTSTGAYPIHATGACVATSLAGLTPSYMPVLPNDPAQNGTTNCYWYISNATGTEYKVRTSAGVAAGGNNDMVAADYQTQSAMIDPQRDATPGNGTGGCQIDAAVAASAWAFYTSGACAL